MYVGKPCIFWGTSGKDSMISLGDGTAADMVLVTELLYVIMEVRRGVARHAMLQRNQLALLMRTSRC